MTQTRKRQQGKLDAVYHFNNEQEFVKVEYFIGDKKVFLFSGDGYTDRGFLIDFNQCELFKKEATMLCIEGIIGRNYKLFMVQ